LDRHQEAALEGQGLLAKAKAADHLEDWKTPRRASVILESSTITTIVTEAAVAKVSAANTAERAPEVVVAENLKQAIKRVVAAAEHYSKTLMVATKVVENWMKKRAARVKRPL